MERDFRELRTHLIAIHSLGFQHVDVSALLDTPADRAAKREHLEPTPANLPALLRVARAMMDEVERIGASFPWLYRAGDRGTPRGRVVDLVEGLVRMCPDWTRILEESERAAAQRQA